MKLKEAEVAERNLDEGWVIMSHPDLEDSYSAVPLPAFEEVWEDKGWTISPLHNPDTGETYSEEERVAQANAAAEARAQEKPADAKAAGATGDQPEADDQQAPKE